MTRVLRTPAFRNLWLGQLLSSAGDAMVIVVLGLYVTDLTGSPAQVGLVLAAYSAPFVLFVLVGGVVADRLPRRRVMIASDAVRAVLHGLLAVLVATGTARVWHLVAIGIVFGTAEAFFLPAYTGLVPQTVAEEDIQHAQAISGASNEGSQLIGPPVGTVLMLAVGASAAFALDALTFVASLVLLLRVVPRHRGGAAAERTSVAAELREGWSAVRERTWVWATIASFSIVLLVALAPFFTLGATIAREQYGSAGVYGLVQTASGAGTIAGALLGARWRPALPLRAAMLAALGWPLGMLAFAVGTPVAPLLAVIVSSTFGLGLFGVWWETALAQRIPPHLLSRVSSYDWMGSLALLPLGYVLSGVLGDAFGAAQTLTVGALIGLLALAAGLLPHETRSLARLEPALQPAQ